MERWLWDCHDPGSQQQFRTRNSISRGTVHLVDDTGVAQVVQAELYPTELRYAQRLSHFGFGSVALPGASTVNLHQGGHRGNNAVLGVEDGRYRPRSMHGGESVQYMVDGAAADGTGGTTRTIVQGLLGWIANLFGATINIGTMADTVTLNVNGQTVNINGNMGDVIVNGVSLVHHVHSNSGGSGDSGPPVQT